MLVPTDETSVKQLKDLFALLSTDHEDLSETVPNNAITFDQAMAILPSGVAHRRRMFSIATIRGA
jgi:hypothetical protein